MSTTPDGSGVDSIRRRVDAQPLGEKLLATAEHNRVNMQAIFVNQIVLGQGMNQHAAAIDDDVLAGLCFQGAYFLDHIAA